MKNSTNYRGMTVGLDVGERRTRYAVLDREGSSSQKVWQLVIADHASLG